jgi:hypothetical protein
MSDVLNTFFGPHLGRTPAEVDRLLEALDEL